MAQKGISLLKEAPSFPSLKSQGSCEGSQKARWQGMSHGPQFDSLSEQKPAAMPCFPDYWLLLRLACGMLEKPQLVHVKAREATVEELARPPALLHELNIQAPLVPICALKRGSAKQLSSSV
eukprot:1161755-Pelagomonas_calceolata.AAC.3